MHDATKILMGSTRSSYREGVTSYEGNAATFPAGTVCRLKSDGSLSKDKADGQIVGVSLGRDLADADRVVVIKAGLGVPVLLTDLGDSDYSYAVIGQPVFVDDETGLAHEDDEEVDSTVTSGIYASGPMVGVSESGSLVSVALVDFIGGL